VDVLGCHIGTFWHALREHTVSDLLFLQQGGKRFTFQYGTCLFTGTQSQTLEKT